MVDYGGQPSSENQRMPLRPHRHIWIAVVLTTLVLRPCASFAGEVDVAAAPHAELAARGDQFRRPDDIPFPKHNPYSAAAALLGRTLFFDARISGSGSLACASCHNPSFGWEDGLKLGHGAGLRDLGRHSPTILNGAWGRQFFWDGRAASLEAQALGPIGNPREMAADLSRLPAKLAAIPGYRPLFNRAYPGEEIGLATIAKALAVFERSVASGPAPFDDWLAGRSDAISDEAKRGFSLFTGQAGCAACHVGWAFTDGKLHDIGLPGSDLGRVATGSAKVEGEHGFKTPTLRNVGRRAPYMHDGSLPDLRAVLAHYRTGGEHRPTLSPMMRPLSLSDSDLDAIAAFLNSLSEPARSFPTPTLPQ